PENSNLEYKESKNSLPKDFWKTYSAFANTKGGLVVLGVSEKDNDFYLSGVNDSSKILKDLHTTLHNQNKVNYSLVNDENIKEFELMGKKIIEIHIKEAPLSKKPIYLNSDYRNTYLRSNDSDRKSTDEELRQMLRNSKDDLDSGLLERFDLDDLNLNTINKYRAYLINDNVDSPYINMPVKKLLIEIGAIKRNRTSQDNDYNITLGGLLFFGKFNCITDLIPHFHLDYFNREGTNDRWIDRVATGDPNYPNLNLFEFFLIVLDKLKLTINQGFKLSEDSHRISHESNDMLITLREALANTLIHSDYMSSETVKIEHLNGYYEFSNPGEMKISIEEFVRGGNSNPRNVTITQLLRRIGFCERAGTGGPKIFDLARKNKLKFPDITTENNKTTLRVWKIDIVSAHSHLGDDEKSVLLFLTKNFLPKSFKEIQEETSLTRHKLTKVLISLEENKLIEKIGQSRATKYKLIESTEEYLTNLQHTFRKIVQFYVENDK
ncbi:ATP-dependent DNA helicase RecG, partial [Listeria monocytogenes]|nr:ATP-dependent DNA helicase RecG [Listeria monocytogenes]